MTEHRARPFSRDDVAVGTISRVHEGASPEPDFQRPLDSEYALEVWHRRKWIALMVFSAALVGAVTGALSLPDLYRSTVTVLVAREQVSEAFVKGSVTAELETRIQTIHQQATSRAGLSDLVTRLGFYRDLTDEQIDTVVDQMRRDIVLELKSVGQRYGSSTIAFSLTYSGRDPQTVSEVANTLATIYVEENTRSRSGQAARTTEFLGTQLAEVKRELDAQENRTAAFKLRNGGFQPEQVLVTLSSLERLYTKLRTNNEAQTRTIDRRAQMEQEIEDAVAGGVVAAGTPPAKTQLATLRQQLAELRRQFTEVHPDVVRAKEQIAVLERQSAEASMAAVAPSNPDSERLKKGIAQADAELKSLKQEEGFLRQTIADYEARIENAPKIQQEFQELSSDYQITKERYEALSKRYEEAELAESLEQGQNVEQFRILDPARPPKSPAAPNRARLLLLGFFASIALAFGAVVAAEKLDTAFHSVDELRAFAAAPTLASIRLIPTQAAARRRRRQIAVIGFLFIIALVLIAAGTYYVAGQNDQVLRAVA